jgi:xanthosine phosphorylase
MTEQAKHSSYIVHDFAPNFKPKVGIILGSGLGDLVNRLTDTVTISYKDLPGFPHPGGVIGHAGNLVLGKLNGVPVACLQGRAHYYEGYDNHTIKTLVRTLKLIGCETLVVTNAAGSLDADMPPGSIMLLTDHINFQFNNALVGPNDAEFGERFIPMNDAYSPALRQLMQQTADDIGLSIYQGVYVATVGPSYETPAEIRAYRVLGANAVGMSTVPDVLVATHCGMKVVAMSVICNFAAGMVDNPPTHTEVIEYANKAANDLQNLVTQFVTNLVKE